MRYMEVPNVMVPVAARSGFSASDVSHDSFRVRFSDFHSDRPVSAVVNERHAFAAGYSLQIQERDVSPSCISQPSAKLPLSLTTCDKNFKSQNGLNQSCVVPGIPPPVHFLPESIYSFQPWAQQSAKEPVAPDAKRKETPYSGVKNCGLSDAEVNRIKKNSLGGHIEDSSSDTLLQCNKNCINALSHSYFPCRLPDVPMNGAEKLAMTGSSNPHSDQLNWLSEVASAAAKGTLNKHTSSPIRNDQPIALPPVLHTVGELPSQLLLSSSGSVFSPPIVVARPAGSSSLRMFTPPFQIERTRHVQHASIPGSGTMYYSQASRTAPLSSFFQATSYHTTVSQTSVTNSSVNNPDPSRSYLQVNNYSSLSGTHTVGSSSQHPCSPSYLQHPHSTSSPTNLVVPSSSHGRMFQQGRSILISRSPDTMIVHSPHDRDPPCHVQIQLSPTLTQQQPQEEATRRKSYTSNDSSVLGSSSCSPVIETAQNTASHGAEFAQQQRTSPPSHVSYRLPTGKEGSLKHRILRPPSINILDPPHSVVADAPLSAPPIRTHREPSPKQARSIPSSGYRSFSSSASSIAEVSNRVVPSPGGTYTNHCSSFSSECPSPAPPSSPGAAAQLKYPQSFMKGSIIQLANNKLKQVEDMTTEDFIECGLLSSTLKIDSSTVVSIEKTPFTGAAKLGFHVGKDNIQITVEAPLEHPFFVYKQGWSSCSPERSAQRYGLTCHKLKVGDVCISLTDKPRSSTTATTANSGQKVTNSSVPIVSVSDPSQNSSTASGRTINKTKEGAPDVIHLPSNIDSPSEKVTNITQSDNQICTGKRKRRWSAPDNLSQNEDGVQSP